MKIADAERHTLLLRAKLNYMEDVKFKEEQRKKNQIARFVSRHNRQREHYTFTAWLHTVRNQVATRRYLRKMVFSYYHRFQRKTVASTFLKWKVRAMKLADIEQLK